MKCEEFVLEQTAVTVVFGGTAAERDAFQKTFLKKYPEFQTETHPCLADYKKPLLMGQKSIVDYLAKQAKNGERKLTEQQLKSVIRSSAKDLGVNHLLDRAVPALSNRQKFLFSLIFRECVENSRSVFVRDDLGPLNTGDGVTVVDWLSRTGGMGGRILLLTESITEKLEDYLGIAERTKDRAIFYQLEQGELTPCDIPSMRAQYREEQKCQVQDAERQKPQVQKVKGSEAAEDLRKLTHDLMAMHVSKEDQDRRISIYYTLLYGTLSEEEWTYILENRENLTQIESEAYDRYLTRLLEKLQ